MKAWLVVLVAVLAVIVASAASATTLGCAISTAGNLRTYTYTLTSTEAGDYVTSLHVYAPLDIGFINGWTALTNWLFDAFIDPDPEVGADIYWYADDYDTHGIPNAGVKQFTLTVPSSTLVENSYIIPGCFGNWGYETQSWPGAVLVSFPSVPVPKNAIAASPEPSSLLILAAGLGLFVRTRRSHKK